MAGKHRTNEVIDVEPVDAQDVVVTEESQNDLYMQYQADQVVGVIETTFGLVPALVAAHPIVATNMKKLLEALYVAFPIDDWATWDFDPDKLEAVGLAFEAYMLAPKEIAQSIIEPEEVD